MVKPLEIGICSWSIDRRYVVRSLDTAANRLALRAVQLGFFTEESIRNADAAEILGTATREGVTLCGTFVGFEGEDYSSIESIAETGGYTPDACWPDRLALTRRVAELTAAIGAHLLAVHAGTVPEDPSSPTYTRLVERVREVAEAMAANDVRLLLETGRESAQVLLDFIAAVDRDNVGINFDPANFVIYGTDDPARAVGKLTDHVELVHMKDAHASVNPGVEFGSPAPLGGGDASIPRVVNKLRAARYAGPLLLECRSHDVDLNGVQATVEYLRSLVT